MRAVPDIYLYRITYLNETEKLDKFVSIAFYCRSG
jgi:hypothetical protein